MAAIDLDQCGLPDSLALRLGGHFGPVYEEVDEVYVTEQFAARLALDRDGFDCDCVGLVPAAKGYGNLRMYHLRVGRGGG